jgi:hypothetical protein
MATYLHFMLPPGLGRHFRIQALRTLVPPDQDDKALQYQGYAVRNSGTMLRKGDQVPGLARDQHTSPGMGKAIAVCSLIFGDSISYLVVSCSLPVSLHISSNLSNTQVLSTTTILLFSDKAILQHASHRSRYHLRRRR